MVQIVSTSARLFAGSLLAGSLLISAASAQQPQPLRIRGAIEAVDGAVLTIKTREGDERKVKMTDNVTVTGIARTTMAEVKPGSYIGVTGMPQADGTQKALEVLVFPEAARGTGEGHFPWDLQPQSTMTNATVADLAAAPASVRGGQQLKLSYKGGEKTVIVPRDTPVVTFKPATDALLVPGAKVLVNAQERSGTPTALRVIAGRNGFTPPM